MLEQVFEQYSAISTPTKVGLLAALAAGALFLSYTESVETAMTSLEQAKAADAQLTNELNTFTKGGQSLAAIEAQKRKAEEDFAMIFELLPKDVEVDKLLASFADSARDSGVAMVKFAPQMTTDASQMLQTNPYLPNAGTPASTTTNTPATPTAAAAKPPGAAATQPGFSIDSLKRVPISVVLEGTFPQVTFFFDKILSLPRIIRLESFKFEPGTQLVSVRVPGMNGGETTKTRTAPDGSPILRVEGQFIAFLQSGFASGAPTSTIIPNTPLPIPALSGNPATTTELSAKPLPAGGAQ